MALPRMTWPIGPLQAVSNSTSAGLIGSFGLRIMRATSMLDLTISTSSQAQKRGKSSRVKNGEASRNVPMRWANQRLKASDKAPSASRWGL